jgi:endonuclease/exonuclease/phosphatase family metal-dependent hydrolase
VPPFPKPKFGHTYTVDEELAILRKHRKDRKVPSHPETRLSIATWNVANLGIQERRESDYRLIAEMISWFDLVALQELRADLSGLRAIQAHLPKSWTAIFTDRSGNDERLAFLYRTDRISHRELVGEVNLLPREKKKVTLKDAPKLVFTDFDRSPMLCSFDAGDFHFTLANVHIYYGAASGAKLDRRRLEVLAVATYAKSRQADETRYDEHLMLIGDFNTPKANSSDKVYRNLLEGGMVPPTTLHGTTVGGKTMGFNKAYDQLVMFPNTKMKSSATKGVFDFDTVMFPDLWSETDKAQQKRFFAYLRYYISDHRLLWTAFDI